MGLKATKSFEGKGKGFHLHKHEHSVNALEGWETRLKKEHGKPLSLSEAKTIHKSRTPRAQKIDENKQAKKVLKSGTFRANQYIKNPNRYDISGVDTQWDILEKEKFYTKRSFKGGINVINAKTRETVVHFEKQSEADKWIKTQKTYRKQRELAIELASERYLTKTDKKEIEDLIFDEETIKTKEDLHKEVEKHKKEKQPISEDLTPKEAYDHKLDSIKKKDLDEFEEKEYQRIRDTGISHKESLDIMINTVEGDYSQLSPKLKEATKLRDKIEKKEKQPIGEDLTTMTNKEIEQNITTLSKKPLKELRKHQDLTEKQMKIAYSQKNEKAIDNLEIRREMLIASISVKEFKDKPSNWIPHINSTIKRVKSYDSTKEVKNSTAYYRNKAIESNKKGDYIKSIEYYDKAIKTYPKDLLKFQYAKEDLKGLKKDKKEAIESEEFKTKERILTNTENDIATVKHPNRLSGITSGINQHFNEKTISKKERDGLLLSAKLKKREFEKKEIITDPTRIQEIKNSISEGEMILKSGKTSYGKKMSKEELDSIQRSVDSSKVKIGLTPTKKEKEHIKGGKADGMPDSMFKKKQIESGIKTEMEEHTINPKIGKEISKDHLVETDKDPNPNKVDSDYYDKDKGLPTLEKKLEKEADDENEDKKRVEATFREEAKRVWKNDQLINEIDFEVQFYENGKLDLAKLGYLKSAGKPSAINDTLIRSPKHQKLHINKHAMELSEKDFRKLMQHEALHLGYSGHTQEFRQIAKEKDIIVSENQLFTKKVYIQTKTKDEYYFKTIKTMDSEDKARDWIEKNRQDLTKKGFTRIRLQI